MLSSERLKRLQRIRSFNNKVLFLTSFLVLRLALKREYFIDKPLDFIYSDKGKPSLKDYPNIHFNLSHTKSAVACALSDSDVGVDVQHIRSVTEKLASRVLTNNEFDFFLHSDNKKEYFCKIWTIKESYVKKIGVGISADFRNIEAESLDDVRVYKRDDYFCSVCGIKGSEVTIDLTGESNEYSDGFLTMIRRGCLDDFCI